ncbi:ABC transporter substrate-binding protein [Thermodesulforhabdus norvegica]|uniref:Iron complex transport system substrate-binding protein n=1 Tax=Thermodesulforhabdus norvegica TaxID=39841 RepID=A0A1I4T710_9BACT|nr:ABC transporter substrate-binding protein [Thermodesulforhabdus norvegica]SFM72357.1 iron complex transport system substrate-binding protein [Thermodesulforhabdus norvegica]
MFFRLLLTILFCLLLVILQYGKGYTSILVKDFRGKSIELKAKPQRIVCLLESALSALFMLQQQDRIIGIANNVYAEPTFRFYRQLDKRIRDRLLPAPGNWEAVSIEHIVALMPDLVIIWSSQTDVIRALETRGIPVYAVFLSRENDIYDEILDFGTLSGSRNRSEELVAFVKKEKERLTRITGTVPEKDRPRVFFMWAQGITETSCGGSTVSDVIRMAGGRNICEHIFREHATLQIEELIQQNPDVIVMWYNEKLNPEDLTADPRLAPIDAIKKGRVYELPDIFTNDLWTLKFIIAANRIARWLYPGLFPNESAKSYERRVLRFLYGSDFN